jgi:hypothetical protein
LSDPLLKTEFEVQRIPQRDTSSSIPGGGGATWGLIAGTLGDQADLQAALDLKASITYVDSAIALLVDSSPAALDTLNELAAALGDDANFAATMTTALAGKANLTGAAFTGLVTATGLVDAGGVRATGTSAAVAGQGIELNLSAGGVGVVQAYDRSAASQLEIRVQGTPVRIRHGATNVITTTAAGADLVGAFSVTGSVAATGTVTASNLSGVNTGDQDLSGYATTAALTAGLAGKEPTIAAGTTAQYWRGDKSWQTLNKAAVGLGNVDNTSDLDKPISIATQTALNAKASLTGASFTGSITSTGAIVSSGANGVGYTTGAGGTVTQATSKSTTVALNKTTGTIVTHNAALAAGAVVEFAVDNTSVAATDSIILNLASGAAVRTNYRYWISTVANNRFRITIENRSAGALSEALTLNFAVIKGVAA